MHGDGLFLHFDSGLYSKDSLHYQGYSLVNHLPSIRSETRVFQKPRHPGEGWDPGNSAIYWIPAFAGMTEDDVYGRTLPKITDGL